MCAGSGGRTLLVGDPACQSGQWLGSAVEGYACISPTDHLSASCTFSVCLREMRTVCTKRNREACAGVFHAVAPRGMLTQVRSAAGRAPQ